MHPGIPNTPHLSGVHQRCRVCLQYADWVYRVLTFQITYTMLADHIWSSLPNHSTCDTIYGVGERVPTWKIEVYCRMVIGIYFYLHPCYVQYAWYPWNGYTLRVCILCGRYITWMERYVPMGKDILSRYSWYHEWYYLSLWALCIWYQ